MVRTAGHRHRQESRWWATAQTEADHGVRHSSAYQQVKRNGGAPGIDGMSVEELGHYLRGERQRIKEAMLDDRYQPQPVKRVEIAKPGGGVRQLGIPTVVDRMIQQALHQVMSEVFEPGFSESSYGFRPGRSAHDAVLKAREYVAEGKRWVVDLDLDKLKAEFRQARGRNLDRQMQELRPLLIGWSNYFRHAQVKATFERLDEWIRRRLRCVRWRQWKKPRTRAVKLLGAGLSCERAWTSAYNGHGPWWNAGESHMNTALPKRYFAAHGLVSLLSRHRRWQAAP